MDVFGISMVAINIGNLVQTRVSGNKSLREIKRVMRKYSNIFINLDGKF